MISETKVGIEASSGQKGGTLLSICVFVADQKERVPASSGEARVGEQQIVVVFVRRGIGRINEIRKGEALGQCRIQRRILEIFGR